MNTTQPDTNNLSADGNEPVANGDRNEVLRSEGIQCYPDRFEASQPNIGDIEKTVDVKLAVAGRVKAVRAFGNMAFVRLQDITGNIQASISVNGIGKEEFTRFKKVVRMGDFIGVTGTTFLTNTEEFTVRVDCLTYLGLSQRPLPDKWKGVRDTELRYRQRYLDLIANNQTRQVFLGRSRLVHSIRNYLVQNGFFEVETPVFNVTRAGALAKPFETYHNALGIDLVLRIAPETYLKRASAAGFNRCFEFAKCFRNEGISPDHLQEFLMLEFYACYWNFRDNMLFTRKLLQHCLTEVFGRLTFEIRDPHDNVRIIDFSGEWNELTFRDAILQTCGIDIDQYPTVASLVAECRQQGIEPDPKAVAAENFGRLVDSLYKNIARPSLQGPVFLIGHPIDMCPLARASDDRPDMGDRFQLVVGGVELTNAYSELVDPVEQRRRLEAQASFGKAGDDEAMDLDEDFLLAMEHGMPPISGCGIGIDRLIKTVLGLQNIRDAVLFPLLRPGSPGDRTDQTPDYTSPEME